MPESLLSTILITVITGIITSVLSAVTFAAVVRVTMAWLRRDINLVQAHVDRLPCLNGSECPGMRMFRDHAAHN